MATMLCPRAFQPCVDSQFIDTTLPHHLNFKPQFLPFEFVAFNSCLLHLDLDSSQSLDQCADVNQFLPNHNAPDSVLPSSDSASAAEANSPMATDDVARPPYVHPLVKRSGSTLSDKSLAICTENLGNETGAADYVEDDVFSDLKIERSPTRKRVKSNHRGNEKLFPPPLTTIAGVDSIRVRSYREDGRLIMAAVEAPSRLSYFHAERSHGRLRLSILKSATPEVEEESTENEEEEEEELRNDDVGALGEKGNCEESVGAKVKENGNLGGVEIEIEKIARPCRCKEMGKNSNNIDENKNNNDILLLTRESLSIWVSTS